jgi:hypothetical protein
MLPVDKDSVDLRLPSLKDLSGPKQKHKTGSQTHLHQSMKCRMHKEQAPYDYVDKNYQTIGGRVEVGPC